MDVFITWSGERSKKVALALREWLPFVVQRIQPFMSDEDIRKGARWRTEIEKKLESVSFGIVCLTSENLSSEWIHFEAGALTKHVNESRVTALLIGIKHSDVNDPLAQFQHTTPSKEDVLKLMKELNSLVKDGAMPDQRLEAVFEKFWPDLNAKISEAARSAPTKAKPTKSTDDMLREILEVSRTNGHLLSRLVNATNQPANEFAHALRPQTGLFGNPNFGVGGGLFEHLDKEDRSRIGDFLGTQPAFAADVIKALRRGKSLPTRKEVEEEEQEEEEQSEPPRETPESKKPKSK